MDIVGLILLGILIGVIGTLIGAGGAFLLTPVLILFYPELSPATITAISITTVFFNSVSGSLAYSRMKRIDYKTGIIFALVMLPGSILGTIVTTMLPSAIFNSIFGAFMLLVSAVVILKSRKGNSSAPSDKEGRFRAVRCLTDQDGLTTAFSFNMLAGILISAVVGFLSGLLGIGGGIFHVPALIFLGFPAHFATATSHFVIAVSSISSIAVHIGNGSLTPALKMAVCLAAGAIAGAQIGARLSKKVKGSAIMICLAVGLAIAGIRILYMGISAMAG